MNQTTQPLLTSILEIHDLSSGARRALLGLLTFRNKGTGLCCPKIDKLCKRLGGAPNRTVRRWIRQLTQAGIVEAIKHRGASSYVFHSEVFHMLKTDSRVATFGQSRVATFGQSGAPYPLYEQTVLNKRVPRIPPGRSYTPTPGRALTMDERVLQAYYAEQRRKAGGQ